MTVAQKMLAIYWIFKILVFEFKYITSDLIFNLLNKVHQGKGLIISVKHQIPNYNRLYDSRN